MTDRLVFVKVNGWEDTLTAQEWGVRGYPTLVLMNADGSEIDRVPGFMPAEDFVQTMDDYANGIGTLDDLLGRYAGKPDSIQLCMEIGAKYQYRGKDSLAESYYRTVIDQDPGNKSAVADDAAFRLALNTYYEGEEKYDDAIAAFSDVVKRYPGSDMAEESATYVPYVMAKQGKEAEALKLYQQFLIDYPESDEVDWVNRQIKALTPEAS